MDGLVQWRLRRDVCKETLSVGQAWSIAMLANILLNEFCVLYTVTIQIECAQLLGQRIGGDAYNRDVIVDLKSVIAEATFSRHKCNGFERAAYEKKTIRKSGKKGGNKGKGNFLDFKPFQDPTSDKFVPPGWCIFFFGRGSCIFGEKCSRKHTRWTAAEFEAGKAKGY